jgi:hypothetical protein
LRRDSWLGCKISSENVAKVQPLKQGLKQTTRLQNCCDANLGEAHKKLEAGG